jgi:outer membrane protein OmpA-like peptidoglycan-associated protein
MRRGTLLGLFAMATGVCLWTASTARADGPEIGVNVGAAMPLSKYRRTVDSNVGGTIGYWSGYRFDVSDHVALSIIGQPQFTFFKTERGCCRGKNDHEESTLFAITGGPKLSLLTGIVETYVVAQGGYYRDMSGPMSDDGAGFNAGGGMNIWVADNTSLGIFGRYDYMNLVASPGSDVDRQMVLGGFALTHVFESPPPAPRMADAPPPPSPPAPAPRATRKIVLRGVHFDFDKSNIRADARPILDEATETLNEEREIHISVEGHTDAIASDAYNQGLSERRARAVADYLSSRNVARGRMRVVGFGESRPVASNATDDGRAQNRRVELRVLAE